MSGMRNNGVLVPVAVLTQPQTAARLIEYLSAEGVDLETFADGESLCESMQHGGYLAVWYDAETISGEHLRAQVEAHCGGTPPLLVRVGGDSMGVADAVIPDAAPMTIVGSLLNLLRRMAVQAADYESVCRVDERLRGVVEHDLRNPLASVVQLADGMRMREVLTPDGRAELAGLLQAAKGAVDRLEAISKEEAVPGEPVKVAPVAIRDVLNEAVRHSGFATSVITWFPKSADPVVRVDAEQFRRVAEHLLCNARTHANGKALVHVRCLGEAVEIEVADRGPGVGEAQPGRGLRYCKKVLESHGGTLRLSDRNPGTHVRCVWPGPVEMREHTPGESMEMEAPLSVWFADDEALVRKALGRLLRGSGYNVHTFETGDALLEHLGREQARPDVIICDADMPGTHGIDVLGRVRLLVPDAARVLYTAYQPTGRVVEAFNEGSVQRFIRKGQDASEIETVLATLAEERKVLGVGSQGSGALNALRADLETLIEDRMCTLFLQPLYDAGSGRMIAAEALLRSKHPSFRGPLDIIDAARAYGREHALQILLSEIGADYRERLPPEVDLFINVDPAILREPERLDEAFSPLYARSANIVLEITERAQLGGGGAWQESVNRLRAKGFRIALDDVGAGYNSLGAVAAVTPEVIKLDISLISNIHQDAQKSELVRLLSDYAGRQGLSTVAEGIEEAAEAARCRELGIRWLQGYHLARPMPFEDLLGRLAA